MAKKPTTSQIEKLIRDNKLDELEKLLEGVDPVEVRMLISETLGDHLDNYDLGIPKAIREAQKIQELPLLKKATMNMYNELPEVNINKLYENKIDRPIKLSVFKGENDDLGFVDIGKKNTPIVNLNTNPDMLQKSPGGVILHEVDHVSDALNKNYIPKQDMLETSKSGLKGAEEAFSKHNKRGFFELEALKKLTKNKLLGSLPIIGAGLTGYSMLESGDVFAADPTGMLQSDNVGEGSDELPMIEQQMKDETNARMKKTKQLMKDK